MRKLIIILSLLILTGCSGINQKENKKSSFLNSKNFKYIVAPSADIPDFNLLAFDYNEKNSLLLIPNSVFPSSLMLIDNKGNFHLIGESGQGPDKINGRIFTGRFISNNIIAALSFFGENALILMDLNGNIIHKYPSIPYKCGGFNDFLIDFDKDTLVFGEYMNCNAGQKKWNIIIKTKLSNPKRKEVLLDSEKYNKLINKYLSGYNFKILNICFLTRQKKAVISPIGQYLYFSEKKKICGGLIFDFNKNELNPFFVTKALKSQNTNIALWGKSLISGDFFFHETTIPKKEWLYKNYNKLTIEQKIILYSGIIHKLTHYGKETGLYVLDPTFWDYLSRKGCCMFTVFNIKGIGNNYAIISGTELYSHNKNTKKYTSKKTIIKIKLFPLSKIYNKI